MTKAGSGSKHGGGLPIDWALTSKRPGAAMGYTLLASSVEGARALALIEAGNTGTPVGENAGRIDALPWVSFAADTNGPTPVLGIVERSWSGERDATGQPILPFRLLAVTWPTSTAALPGFGGLLALARSVRWSGVDGPPEGANDAEPIVRTVPPVSVDLMVRAIDDIGFEWALAAAVALLDGDQVVVVTRGQVFSLQQRVQVLDAVCALLPYGCRAWVSASTWAQDRSAHPVRLSFAEHGKPGQRVLDFDDLRLEQPRTSDALAYLAEMTHLKSEGFTTARIVEHLAALHEPLAVHETRPAVEHLRELRLVASTVEDITNGKGVAERVDTVLTRFGWSELAPAPVAIIVSFLVTTAGDARSGRAAREVLRRHWSPVAQQSVVDVIASDLLNGNIERTGRWLAVVAGLDPTVRDQVVAAMLQSVAPAVDPAVAERTVALLVETRALSFGNVAAWEVLARCPELGARLLRPLPDRRPNGDDARLRRTLEALAPHRKAAGAGWVDVAAALFADGGVDPDAGRLPEPVLRILLDVARAQGVVRQFLGVAWEYVLHVAYQPDARGGFPDLRDIARQVTEGTAALGPEAAAAAQLLALGAQRRPGLTVDAQDLRPFATAWRAAPEAARGHLAERLPAAVLGRTMTPESFGTLVAVAAALDAVDGRRDGPSALRNRAVTEVSERLIRSPDLLPRLALDETWGNDLVQYAPQYAWLAQWSAVHRTASEGDVATIRDAYARLRSAGAPQQAALSAITPWLLACGPDGLDALLISFGRPTGDGPPLVDEIRGGVFAEPELRDLGGAYYRLVRDRRLHYQQQYDAVRELLQRERLPPPSYAPEPPAAVDPQAGGPNSRLWLRSLFGDRDA